MDAVNDIKKAVEHIEKNLKEKLKVSDLSKIAHFSEFHFQRLFRNTVGDTVMAYVRKKRLTEAARDLINKDDKITDIAMEYQFGSEEAFSRAFSKAFGLSPKEYRKKGVFVVPYERPEVSGMLRESSMTKRTTMCMAA